MDFPGDLAGGLHCDSRALLEGDLRLDPRGNCRYDFPADSHRGSKDESQRELQRDLQMDLVGDLDGVLRVKTGGRRKRNSRQRYQDTKRFRTPGICVVCVIRGYPFLPQFLHSDTWPPNSAMPSFCVCTTSVQDRLFLKDVFSGGLAFEQCSVGLAEGQGRSHDGLATWCNTVAPVFGKLVNQAMGA